MPQMQRAENRAVPLSPPAAKQPHRPAGAGSQSGAGPGASHPKPVRPERRIDGSGRLARRPQSPNLPSMMAPLSGAGVAQAIQLAIAPGLLLVGTGSMLN